MRRRVALLEGKGKIRIIEEDLPRLRDDEVLIKVKATGICSGDLYAYLGYRVWFKPPAKFGHEPTGEVVEVGSGVTRVKVGDQVVAIANEAYADYVIVRQDWVEVIRRDIPPHLALGEPAACVVNGVRLANPRLGDTVAVVGTGFMGLLLVQALRGIARVIAVDIDDNRLALAREFGAEVTLNPTRDDVAKEIKDLTDGQGADIVIEATGNPNAVKPIVDYVRRRGTLVIFSYHPKPVEVDLAAWDAKGVEVIMANPNRAEDMRVNLRIAARMINQGIFKMDKLVTHRWRLDQINEAFEYASGKPREYIKGVIEP